MSRLPSISGSPNPKLNIFRCYFSTFPCCTCSAPNGHIIINRQSVRKIGSSRQVRTNFSSILFAFGPVLCGKIFEKPTHKGLASDSNFLTLPDGLLYRVSHRGIAGVSESDRNPFDEKMAKGPRPYSGKGYTNFGARLHEQWNPDNPSMGHPHAYRLLMTLGPVLMVTLFITSEGIDWLKDLFYYYSGMPNPKDNKMGTEFQWNPEYKGPGDIS